MTIKTKILIPVMAIILLVAAAILVSDIVLFSGFVDGTEIDRIDAAARVAADRIEFLKTKASAASLRIAENRDVVSAVMNRDRDALLSLAERMQGETGAMFCTITDAEGAVILRTHQPEDYGDSVAPQANVKSALAGKSLAAVEKGAAVRLSVRAGAPIHDGGRTVLGVVSVGHRLDTEQFVDSIKEMLSCEVTILLDGERISTTVLKEDGARAIGTRASAGEKAPAGGFPAGPVDILGRAAVGKCVPVAGPDGRTVAMLLIARYAGETEEIIHAFVQRGVVVTAVMLASSSLVILVIVKRVVAPIRLMTRVASALAAGDTAVDIHVETRDEIRALADAFENMIDNARQQVQNIEHVANGDLTASLRVRSDGDTVNRSLQKLNETIRAQAAAVEEERERVRLMLADIERRDNLLQTVNQAADILLRSGTGDFPATLGQCMGMMARAVNADRVYLFKNHLKNGKLCCTQLHEWSERVQPFQGTESTTDLPYDRQAAATREALSRGECVHSRVRDLPPGDRRQLGAHGVLSIMTIPIFIHHEFWGFVGFDNCRDERLFTEDEESVMRSASMLIANALLRNENMLRIQDASARVEAALADVKEANAAKSSFLAHMSHEIRTPLNAVIGLSELTLGEAGLSREAAENLEKICGAGSTILGIANDILDISKIESGKFAVYPVRYDVPGLINDTVALNAMRIREKGVAFRLHADENLPVELYGDDLRVKQVFNNLLSNAFKYTDSGIVEWRVSAERDGDSVWLVSSVRDTGIGIRPEDMRKLFADYNQVDTRANRKVGGTGLGLAIAKRLVEMMDGTIAAESEYGSGSTFTVRLRQGFASEASIGGEVAGNLMELRYTSTVRARHAKLARRDLSCARVLVVDDIATNLDVAKGMMKPYGMKIDCAGGGLQAVEMIRAGVPRYDAVFMDHMMPDVDGMEATRIIREEVGTEYARTVPIIALTANAIVGNEEMFLSRGFQAFIPKPIDMMQLDSVLRLWVGNANAEKEPSGTAGEARPPGDGPSPADGAASIDGVDARALWKRFGGDGAVVAEVLRSYAANTPPLLDSLWGCLETADMKKYAVVAHGVKGSSYGISAREVGRAAEELERAAKRGDLGAVRAGHAAFDAIAQALLGDMGRALGDMDAAARKPVAAEPDAALLAELRAACEAFDMDGVDRTMERIGSFRYERGEKLVAWLRKKISDMAFEDVSGGAWPAG